MPLFKNLQGLLAETLIESSFLKVIFSRWIEKMNT